MSRVSYNLLPTEGARQARDVSRIVNQAMSGQQNIVRDISIPAGGLDSGSFTVNDPRVSSQKYVHLIPMNTDALFIEQSVFVANIRKGAFDIGTYPAELQKARVQVANSVSAGGGGPDLNPRSRLPISRIDFEQGYTVDLGNNLITVNSDIPHLITFTISGVYDSGTDYDFGVAVVSGPSAGAEFSVGTSTSNQNDSVSVGATLLAPLVTGDVLEIFGAATKSGAFQPHDLLWMMTTEDGARAIPSDDGPFNFRALIIG